MKPRSWSLSVLLLSLLLLCPLGSAIAEGASARPAVVTVRAGNKTVSGLVLNTLGHIAAPAVTDGDGDWTVECDGERYPAMVASRAAKYGLVILKVSREKTFPFAVLAQKQASFTGKYALLGLNEAGTATELKEVGIRRVRRRVPEAGLDGSYYELAFAGTAPQPGAALVDPATGEVHGLLLPPLNGLEERLALFTATVSERAAAQNVVLGAAALPKGPSLLFADGRMVEAKVRYLHLGADANRSSLQQTRAIDDWRKYSGFWINHLTSPAGEGSRGYIGSVSGRLYSLDLNSMQRDWLFPNEYPVFAPPSLSTTHVVCTSGSLNLTAWLEVDPVLYTLFGALITKTKRFMVDYGVVNCVDRTSGAFKWSYKTRFLSQAQIVENKVLFAGMGTLGVLNLADGKEVWTLDLDRKDTTPEYYVLAGADAERMWVYATKVTMEGKGITGDPYRLAQQGAPSRVECYSVSSKALLWSAEIKPEKDAPALSGAMLLSPDRKTCYGAAAKSMFAVDAATGAPRWQTPVFAEFFGGNLSFGDNMLFGNSADHLLYAVDPADGKVLWTFNGAKAAVCAPLAQDGMVYVGSLDTWLYALEARTGKLVWKLETGGKLCGQPRIIGNKLYCTSDDGRLTEIELPQ